MAPSSLEQRTIGTIPTAGSRPESLRDLISFYANTRRGGSRTCKPTGKVMEDLHFRHVTKRALHFRSHVRPCRWRVTSRAGQCNPRVSSNAQLERILGSPPLQSSPSLCRLLRYVVEETLAGRAGALKEYSLGAEVFGRGDEFDPRMDPIVRVQARNLRVRLAQYYDGPGAVDAILIELPKRTYVPVFHRREDASDRRRVPAFAGRTRSSRSAGGGYRACAVPCAGHVAWHRPAARAGRMQRGHWPRLSAAGARRGGHWPLSVAPPEPRTARHEPDPRAQDLYIRGRYVMDRQTEPALREASMLRAGRPRSIPHSPRLMPAWPTPITSWRSTGYISPVGRHGAGPQSCRSAPSKSIPAWRMATFRWPPFWRPTTGTGQAPNANTAAPSN